MNFEVTGKLVEKYPAVDVSGKFRKREFVISKTEISNNFDFTDYIKFQLTQDRCSLIEQYSTGDELKVSFNLRGRRWEKDGNVSYFTNLEAWKIERINSDKEQNNLPPSSEPDSINPPDTENFVNFPTETDDLPF